MSVAVLVPVIAASSFLASRAPLIITAADFIASAPNNPVSSVRLMFSSARFSKAPARPTIEGLNLLSASFSSFNNTCLKPVPASAANKPPLASSWTPTLASSKLNPARFAATPAFFMACAVSVIEDEPSLAPAANTFTKRLAWSASAPNWLRDTSTVDAASAKPIPAASANLTASFVTAANALAFWSKSGFALAINLNASAAWLAERVVVLPINAACSS